MDTNSSNYYEQMVSNIITIVTDAVMTSTGDVLDDRTDWIMREVQQQILDFEHRVNQALDQIASDLAQRLVIAVQTQERETAIFDSYRRWVLSEAAALDIGVGEFAKIVGAMKAAEKAGNEGGAEGGAEDET